MPDYSHRVTAAALRRRGFVQIKGKGPTWEAEPSDTGWEYLSRVDSSNPPIPRQANVSVTEQLVLDVIEAGGTLKISSKNPYDHGSIDYLQRAKLAEARGKVPKGKWLIAVRRSEGHELRLVDAPQGIETGLAELVPVEVPAKIGRYHPVARHFRDTKKHHEISRDQLARGVRILHVIAVEAERRGWKVSRPKSLVGSDGGDALAGAGNMKLTDGDRRYGVALCEKGVHVRGTWEEEVRRYRDRTFYFSDREKPEGPYDANATGILQLELIDGGPWNHDGRQYRWSDRKSWKLESRLPQFFQEIDSRKSESMRIALQKSIEAEARVTAERRAIAERDRIWHAHQTRAKELLIQDEYLAALKTQMSGWEEATRVRAYADAVEAKFESKQGSQRLVDWARAYATRLDPLHEAPELPAELEFNEEQLQPYFPDGWSAWGPERGSQAWRYKYPFLGN